MDAGDRREEEEREEEEEGDGVRGDLFPPRTAVYRSTPGKRSPVPMLISIGKIMSIHIIQPIDTPATSKQQPAQNIANA